MALKNGRPITNTNTILLGTVTPSGIIQTFGSVDAPNGWLKCEGQAVSRTTYASLFAAIGTTFGSGNGSTTFNLPDMRGYFARGFDAGAGVDPGRVFGSAQTDAFQGHWHNYDNSTSTGGGTQNRPTASTTSSGSSVPNDQPVKTLYQTGQTELLELQMKLDQKTKHYFT